MSQVLQKAYSKNKFLIRIAINNATYYYHFIFKLRPKLKLPSSPHSKLELVVFVITKLV